MANAAQTAATIENLLGVLQKLTSQVRLDITDPANVFNFSADAGIVASAKAVYSDGKALVAELKAEI